MALLKVLTCGQGFALHKCRDRLTEPCSFLTWLCLTSLAIPHQTRLPATQPEYTSHGFGKEGKPGKQVSMAGALLWQGEKPQCRGLALAPASPQYPLPSSPSSRLPITACFFRKSLHSFLFRPKASMLWVNVLQEKHPWPLPSCQFRKGSQDTGL